MTHRHETRIANLKKLVAEFGKRNLMKDDICNMFAFSPSGARSYAKELVEHGVIFICDRIKATPSAVGEAVYQLTADSGAIAEFLRDLDSGAPKRPSKTKVTQESKMAGAGRHFHILADDERFAVRIHRVKTGVDPLALPGDFFKPSTEFCERRSVPRVEQPRLTGFAALDVHFSRAESDLKAAEAVRQKQMRREIADGIKSELRHQADSKMTAEAFASDRFIERFARVAV